MAVFSGFVSTYPALFKMITEQHIKSAIRGFYRQGATYDEIGKAMNLKTSYVINVCKEYFGL